VVSLHINLSYVTLAAEVIAGAPEQLIQNCCGRAQMFYNKLILK